MIDCYSCPAKSACPAVCQRGSIMCMIKLLQSGASHADVEEKHAIAPKFCAHCGKPLKVIGTKRFCNNASCGCRYVNV